MTDPELESPLPDVKEKHVVRRIVEALTFIALVLVVSYWPTTHAGRLFLVALGVIALFGMWLMRKWSAA